MSLSIKELERKLRKANEEYYKGNPIMSDDEFDSLFDELETRDPNHAFLTKYDLPKFVNLNYHVLCHH